MRTWHKNLSLSLATTLFFSTSLALADEIKTNTAVLQAMDKVTGRVKVINVPVNGTVDFGTFSILIRDCQTRPPEETPENYAFVDIIDNNIDGSKENIFKGWMMSSTPALNAVEHPIYDVWLLKCVDTNVDKSKLLTTEELEARDVIAKRVIEDKKLKEDFAPEELEAPADEEVKPIEQTASEPSEETPQELIETTQELIEAPQPEEIVQQGIIESEIVVKGLTPDEVSTPDMSQTTEETKPEGVLDATTPQEAQPADEFYDEFDSLIEE